MSVARMSLRDQVDMLTNGVRYGEQIIRERNDRIAELEQQLAARDAAGPFLVEAFYGDSTRLWNEHEQCATREAAEPLIAKHRATESCYLVELWQHAGCRHAIG
jgi:hypothetical protein